MSIGFNQTIALGSNTLTDKYQSSWSGGKWGTKVGAQARTTTYNNLCMCDTTSENFTCVRMNKVDNNVGYVYGDLGTDGTCSVANARTWVGMLDHMTCLQLPSQDMVARVPREHLV